MSDEMGTYSFLPWLRQGIANNIESADLDSSVKLRATIHVELGLDGKGVDGLDLSEVIEKDINLYGPGDIIGIDSKAIIKNEPLNWITNFETNYLPYIDFYDEDFPWRYTPSAPDTSAHRLRPWITLVVLKEDEFTDGKNIKDKPLSFIEVSNAANVFPPAEQLWAWAHVHVDRDVVKLEDHMINTNKQNVLGEFKSVLNSNPDLAHSRILCPRKLDENSAYHAFLIPTFETGRVAGLGLDLSTIPAEVHATFSAWADYTGRADPQFFPYYHRWFFRTGSVGDFEYLVRLLEPKPMDSRVGQRDMDVQNPAVHISGITDESLGGILKLGGALRIPFDTLGEDDQAEVTKYDEWDQPYPHEFQQDLGSFINLTDDYNTTTAEQANQDSALAAEFKDDPDPLITAPLYGRWHALTKRLDVPAEASTSIANPKWVHQLNLDPRWRVAAGFGTNIVQSKQEEYMDAAWSQVGEILEANRKIRYAQLAKTVSSIWYRKYIAPIAQTNLSKAIMLTTPVHKRILNQGQTVFYQVKSSTLPNAALSAPMRRVTRSTGRLMRGLPFNDDIKAENLIERLNQQEIFVAPPKTVAETVPVLDELAEDLKPDEIPEPLQDVLEKYPQLYFLLVLLALILLVILLPLNLGGLATGIIAVVLAGLIYLAMKLRKWAKTLKAAASVSETQQTPESVDELPASADFHIADIGSGFVPQTGGSADSVEAVQFKQALTDTYRFVQASGKAAEQPVLRPLNLNLVASATIDAINPELTLPRFVLNNIKIPAYIFENMIERFQEAMAYPVIDLPMYKPLVDISTELFLPNINHVPNNSISLLETNQKFIEAYMVGLNHEFARELLWREYPTDQRGSYFRQFWDVSSYLNVDDLDEEALREQLRDIPPLHRWSRFSELGDHDNRETDGESEEELVLVIRGELLKKYPDAVIYAHRAKWQLNDEGEIDNTQERIFDETDPIVERIKTPLYEAKVDPDINFFGFDITAEEAQGGTGENPDDDPGWFFVIKERPGEPRFGLDIDREGDINLWNDLSWDDALPGATAGQFLQITNSTTPIELVSPVGNASLQEKFEQYEDDKHLSWHKDTNAAELAYILYQVPVLVGVHASEMLPKE